MFHFRRSTLWIIIYITIPLVAVLHAVAPKPEESESADRQPALTSWSLDSVDYQCSETCNLLLPGSRVFFASFLLTYMPTRSVSVPEHLSLTIGQQGGEFILTLSGSLSDYDRQSVVQFLKRFLPADGVLGLVLSGPESFLSDGMLLHDASAAANGDYIENKISPQTDLTRLPAPAFGTQDQLAFLLWIEILKQRLAGYQIRVNWDHRASVSYVGINSTLTQEALAPITLDELTPVVNAYKNAANQRVRSAHQLHRYAVTARLYQLPFSYFVQQPARLSQITLSDINQIREVSLGYLKKKQ